MLNIFSSFNKIHESSAYLKKITTNVKKGRQIETRLPITISNEEKISAQTWQQRIHIEGKKPYEHLTKVKVLMGIVVDPIPSEQTCPIMDCKDESRETSKYR